MVVQLLGGFVGTREDVAAADLKRLDSVKDGLGTEATAYVCTGARETVLSSVAALCRSNELEICKSWVNPSSPTLSRRKLFARLHPYNLDFVQRYAEVLSAAIPTAAGAAGSDFVPKAVRIFFSEGFFGMLAMPNAWPRRAEPLDGKGLVPNVAIAMVQRLGGNLTDFFDVLYCQEKRYSISGEPYRKIVDLRPIAEEDPRSLIAAANRVAAVARTELLRDLAHWSLGKSQAFTEFLVAQAADGSKSVREVAIAALADVPFEAIEPLVTHLLQSGAAGQRLAMVDLLARLGSAKAGRVLKTHRKAEKTARVQTAIDAALSLIQGRDKPAAQDADGNGYTAMDGQFIEVPPLRPLAQGEIPKFGEADRAALKVLIAKENERLRKHHAAMEQRGHKYQLWQHEEKLAHQAVDFFNTLCLDLLTEKHFLNFVLHIGSAWTRDALKRLPEARAFEVIGALSGARGLHNFRYGPAGEPIRAYLNGPDGDLRMLEALDIKAGRELEFGRWGNRHNVPMQRGALLRSVTHEHAYPFEQRSWAGLPKRAVWPYLAENLDVFDEALGLKPPGHVILDRVAAIRMLTYLPATPARYFVPFLEAATGETKAGRAEARALLSEAPDIEKRLVELLDDSRQSVRAGAADWLSVRGDASAVQALNRRLKKEKSDVARAAMLTALKRLGADLSKTLGAEALIAEAQKGLKSAKLDKLEWLALANLPNLRFSKSKGVPAEVLRWWVYLAFKLKQPGGNALFDIYLDQLEPKAAETFSSFILDAWLAYDTARPSDAEANAYAKAHTAQHHQAVLRWNKEYTEERAFADLKQGFRSQYLNTAAETKGVLALAKRAAPALASDRVRFYLKNHGSRTSQASALLEMLAAIGDPVTLQVVISAAARLKQKSVQKSAKDLITKVAEQRGWSLDELADRTVPTAGFDSDGILALPCGEDAKIYEARLKGDFSISLRNPAGKEVVSLPSTQDEAAAASKKLLATARKELKQIAAIQSARLYEALCAERSWPAADWLRFFHEHPVMRRLVERVVWLGADAAGKIKAFRPTAEGDFTDENDNPVNVPAFNEVRLAHGALLGEAEAKAWKQHFADYEIKPLFEQFGRPLLRLRQADARKTEIEDRKGWVTHTFTIRGAAAKLGYDRGAPLDGGFFNEYRKSFQSAGLTAVIEFTGNSLPEANVAAALIKLHFQEQGSAVALGDVPPVLLSECWNDYHAMAAKAAYDPEWEKKSPW
jgi:HEAT repeat protein